MQHEMFGYYLTLAWQRCRKNLPMVALLILTMAIGIASCMTALTIFAALSGDPLPGISGHLYVATMDARTEKSGDNSQYTKPNSYLGFTDAKALVDMHRAHGQSAFAQSYQQVGDADGAHSDQVAGLMAYGQAIELLGVSLRYGRTWTPAEEQQRAPLVAIDTELARKLFGTEDAVGRNVHMGQRLFRVVGVFAPWKPRTKFMDLPHNSGQVLEQSQQFFIPVQAALDGGVGPMTLGDCEKGVALVSFQSTEVGQCRWLEVWLSLGSAAEVGTYQRLISDYGATEHSAGRFTYAPQTRLFGTGEWMAANHVVPDDVEVNMMLASGFLLLCMVNVAGILAAYFLRRQADTVIRRALGASQRQLFAQHVLEAGLLGLAGGVLALPLTLLGLQIVKMQPVAYAETAHFDVTVFSGLLVLSVAVGLVVGILPAWHVCRLPPALLIKQG
jgi:putative ABC transport system permease protein